MTKIRRNKVLIISAILAFLCSMALAIPYAFGYSYIHTDAESNAGSTGVISVSLTIDETAVGGGVVAAQVLVPADDNTVDAVFAEAALSSEDRSGTESHYDYSFESVSEYLSGREYTVSVYAAGSQERGAGTSYTGHSIGDQSYSDLRSGDGIYVMVTGI